MRAAGLLDTCNDSTGTLKQLLDESATHSKQLDVSILVKVYA
jgi:hypothetical protein